MTKKFDTATGTLVVTDSPETPTPEPAVEPTPGASESEPAVETPSAAMTRTDLIAAMDAHEAEGARLDATMAELGLTAKDVKAIRKAEKAAAAARKVLAELMGENA